MAGLQMVYLILKEAVMQNVLTLVEEKEPRNIQCHSRHGALVRKRNL